MKISRILVLFILLFSFGCYQIVPTSVLPTLEISSATGDPAIVVGDSLEVENVARAYLDAWKGADYPTMYALLTSISKAAISEEEFTRHYQSVVDEAALSGVEYQILSTLTNPETAQISYRVTLTSVLVGDIQADTLMNLSLEGEQWKVQWDDTLVLPQLKGDNYLALQRDGYKPARANIYDRYGHALVAQTDATAIGLFPDQIDPGQEQSLLIELSELTGLSAETIRASYAGFPEGAGWYLPVGEVPAEQVASRYEFLEGQSGLVMSPYKARYYFEGGIAPHVLGYVSAIQPEEVDEYERKGYQSDERVGRSGLEKWGEEYLAGGRGGALYVMDSSGQPVTRLAETPATPSQSIYTTIDKDFQLAVRQALSSFRGAVVVLERDTGRVLAMVSTPGFNPNAFEPINFNSDSLLNALQSEDRPLFNRAAQGQYPLGSVFKIITMSAALESGLYTPESTYYCDTKFEEIAGVTLYDWTHEHKVPPSGMLTLPGGLIRSCNPWFYHIGLDLFNQGLVTAVTDMARSFGLGSPTGIEGVDEAAGQIPDPTSQIEATNEAIGQGALLVTPLQVASFIAAIGNGGTLYTPQVIEMIKPPDGEPTYVFEPQARAALPLRPGTLRTIQDALVGVVESTDPRGTAYHVFTNLDIPTAGKTGTAQTGHGAPHAWYTGYTFAEREDKPDIAVVVLVENIGEGSDYAAPIFRRIIELYYRDSPGKLYDWESTYNVTQTPTPVHEVTPTPEP